MLIRKFTFRNQCLRKKTFCKSYQLFSEAPKEDLKQKLKEISSNLELNEPKNIFTKYIFFDNKMDVIMFNSQYRYYKLTSVLWIFIGTLTFLFIHPLVCVIPSYLASGNMLSTFLTNKFAKTLVYKMELSKENINFVNLYIALHQKVLKCEIKDIVLQEIKEIDVKEKKKKYLISFEVQSENSKKKNILKLYLDLEHNRVENFQLFKHILTSDLESLKNMKFNEVKEVDPPKKQEQQTNPLKKEEEPTNFPKVDEEKNK